jgi:hypothetical protein
VIVLRRAAPVLIAVATWWIAHGVAVAGSGEAKLLPFSRVAAVHGVQMHVNSHWVEGNGHRPIRIELRNFPVAPTLQDRVFRIEVSPDDDNYWSPHRKIVSYLTIPEGATQAATVVPLPQITAASSIRIEVYEGGVRLRELSDSISSSRLNRRNHTEHRPSALFVSQHAPPTADRATALRQIRQGKQLPDGIEVIDWRQMTRLFKYSTRMGGGRTLAPGRLIELVNDTHKFEVLGFTDLPNQWSLYSCFDVIFISIDDLKDLVEQHPDRWTAMRRWIAGGATLYVTNVGSSFERRDELDGLLELATRENVAGGWRTPRVPPVNYVVGAANTPNQARSMAPNVYRAADDLRMRQLGLGVVIAVGRREPFRAPPNQQAALFNSIGPNRWSWARRYGASLSRRNTGFWRRMIPGVGTPPVNAFLITMTAFAIIVGPLNYLILYRKKRLYLLFVTFPLTAAALTIGLLVYAMITDGFGSRVRVRGVTYLDADRREFTSLSWQTYYASLAPSDGLAFPRQALVFPISYWRSTNRQDRNNLELTEWGREQRLRSGFIKSRVMTQFLVQHAGPTEMRLKARPVDGGVEITNQLNSQINAVLLRREGKFFFAENVAAGAVAVARPIDLKQAKENLRQYNERYSPKYPEGFDPTTYQVFSSNRIYYGDYIDQEFTEADDMASVLEKAVSAVLVWPERAVADGNFAAVVETSPAPIGIKTADRQTGGEVIVGSWSE